MNKGLVAVLLAIIAIVIIAALWTSILLMVRKSSRRSAISLTKNSKIEENSAEYLIQKSSCSNLGKISLFLPSLWSIKGMKMSMGRGMKLRFNNVSGDCNKTLICIYQEDNNIMISYWSNQKNEYLVASVIPITNSNNTATLNIENCRINVTFMKMNKTRKQNKSMKNTTLKNNTTTSNTNTSSSSQSSSSTTNTISPVQEEYKEALTACLNKGGTLVNKTTIEEDIFNSGQFYARFPYYLYGIPVLGTIFITSVGNSCTNVNYFCQLSNKELYYWDSNTKTFILANYTNTRCSTYGLLVYATLQCTPGSIYFSCGVSFFNYF